jgi:hypothetical protein
MSWGLSLRQVLLVPPWLCCEDWRPEEGLPDLFALSEDEVEGLVVEVRAAASRSPGSWRIEGLLDILRAELADRRSA